MNNDAETQHLLRIFNKMNKLFEREKVAPDEVIIALSICLAHAACEYGISEESFTLILEFSREHYRKKGKNPSNG